MRRNCWIVEVSTFCFSEVFLVSWMLLMIPSCLREKTHEDQNVLPVISLIFWRSNTKANWCLLILWKPLPSYLCDYRKRFSMQQALLSLREKWEMGEYIGAILMDLPKASENWMGCQVISLPILNEFKRTFQWE